MVVFLRRIETMKATELNQVSLDKLRSCAIFCLYFIAGIAVGMTVGFVAFALSLLN